MKKLTSLILAGAMAVCMFASCNTNGNSNSAGVNGYYPGTPTADSVTVNIGGEPPTMFNILSIDSKSNTVLSHILDSLVIQDESGAIVPNAAESWKYDEETLTYTFYIREGQVWSNGDPVTAHDFEFGWKALLNPEFAATYAYAGFIIKNGEAYTNGEVTADKVGVKALDDYTLEVVLESPTPYALSRFSQSLFAPINEKAYNEITAEFGPESYGTDPDKLVTNGPYVVTEWMHEDYVLLEKMEGYNGPFQVEIPKIYFKMITDANAAMNAFRAGELDYMFELTGEQAELLKGEGAPVIGYQSSRIHYIDYNYSWPGLDNENIRKALTLSVNNEELCTNVLKSSSKPAYTIVPQSITELSTGDMFYNRVGDQFAYDPEQALTLLETGLAEEGLTKETLNLTIICDDTTTATTVCAYLQEQWKTKLGIDVKIEVMPYKSRIQHLIDQDFCLCLDSWGLSYNDPSSILEVFISTNGNNAGLYVNEEYDALMALAASEADEATRYEILAEAEKILIGEDMGPGPLYYEYKDVIASEKVEGLVITAFQYTWRFASINPEVVE